MASDPEARAAGDVAIAPDLALMRELSSWCRREIKQRRQLLGWWLPAAGALLLCGLWLFVGVGLAFVLIGGAMLFVFHRYHRWKLAESFAGPPRFVVGTIGHPKALARGQRQSHGLMFPVEFSANLECALEENTALMPCSWDQLVWIDGGIAELLQAGDRVGLVSIAREGVLVAQHADRVLVSRALELPASLRERVTVVHAVSDPTK